MAATDLSGPEVHADAFVIDAATKLAAVVTRRPELAAVLDGLGLDFCCDGQLPFGEACAKAGRSVESSIAVVRAALAVPALAADWSLLDPVALVAHIVSTHHQFLRSEAPQVASLGRKVLAAHGDNHPELGAVIATYGELWGRLEPHLDEEESGLFVRVASPKPIDADEVDALVSDHEVVGELLDRLRVLTDRFLVPDDGCRTYVAFYGGLDRIDADTRLHIHKENNVLFPAVLASARGERPGRRWGEGAPGSFEPTDEGVHDAQHRSDLVVVASRLPVHCPESSGRSVTSPGGLVSALQPVLARRAGMWIGWNPSPRPLPRIGPINIKGVALPTDIADEYYAGYSNRVLWPALHGMADRVESQPGWWEAYRTANQIFADVVARVAVRGAIVWVHDYHFLLLPSLLAARRPDLGIGLFLHTPVADVGVIDRLEHRDELLAGISGARLVGTQRASDASNLESLLGSYARRSVVPFRTVVKAHPISLDVERIVDLAHDPDVRNQARSITTNLGAGRRIVLSVDRLDYTKGVLERLTAFEKLLELGLVSADDVMLIQVAVPSRIAVPAYRELAERVKAQVRRINSRYPTHRGSAIELICEDLPLSDVVALYLAAEIAMVTPLRDGMNLVAKEFAIARAGDPVGLVLATGAGAADELGADAVLVDATDPVDLAAGLNEALHLGVAERVRRSTALGHSIAARDVHAWAAEFLEDLQQTILPAGAHAFA